MSTNYIRLTAGAMFLGLLLAGCEKAPPADTPVPATPAESPAAPADAAPAPGEVPPPDAAEPAPAPTPEAPPPTEPSPVPRPTANEPDLESMPVASVSAKASVPVTLHYQVEGEALPNQPITVHLAAVPRVAGASLQVEVKGAAGLQIASTPMRIEKANPATPYRQQLAVTRAASGPQDLRVLVTMDLGGGTAFGYFTVPLASGTSPQKQDSVKQR
jgi:hypothetical protein